MKNSHVSFYRTAYFTAKGLLAHENVVCLAGPKESGKMTITQLLCMHHTLFPLVASVLVPCMLTSLIC